MLWETELNSVDEPAEVWSWELSKGPIRSLRRGEAGVKSRNRRVFEEGFTLVTLEGAKGPPDTRALARRPAGPCCPPDVGISHLTARRPHTRS